MAPNNQKFNIGDEVRVIYDFFAQYDNGRDFSIQNQVLEIIDFIPQESIYTLTGWSTNEYNRYILKYGNNHEYRYLVREQDLELISSKEPINKITKLMKLNSMMRRLLTPDLRKLIKAGLMNGDLLLTEEGKNALYALLVETHKKELVEIANDIIKEQKEERE